MNKEVKHLLKACNQAIKSRDPTSYSVTRWNMKKGTEKAKDTNGKHVEDLLVRTESQDGCSGTELLCNLLRYLQISLISPWHWKWSLHAMSAITVLVLKKWNISNMNDYPPIALTPTIIKCFERLVLSYIKAKSLPPWSHINSLTELIETQRIQRMPSL